MRLSPLMPTVVCRLAVSSRKEVQEGPDQFVATEADGEQLRWKKARSLTGESAQRQREHEDSFYAPDPLPIGPHLEADAVVRHPELQEVSGVVKSQTYPDLYWIHADGGDRLYIADLGNNGNARRDLGIYVLTEPNPVAIDKARVMKWLPVAFPDQSAYPPSEDWTFDCEALFVYDHKPHVLTKHRVAHELGSPITSTKLYRLDAQKTDEVNEFTLVDSFPDLGGWVTAADTSPDGATLAVLTHTPESSVWLFDLEKGERPLSQPTHRFVFHGTGFVEAVTFMDEDRVMVVNEEGEIHKIALADFAPLGHSV